MLGSAALLVGAGRRHVYDCLCFDRRGDRLSLIFMLEPLGIQGLRGDLSP
jgi:hypothetical protein